MLSSYIACFISPLPGLGSATTSSGFVPWKSPKFTCQAQDAKPAEKVKCQVVGWVDMRASVASTTELKPRYPTRKNHPLSQHACICRQHNPKRKAATYTQCPQLGSKCKHPSPARSERTLQPATLGVHTIPNEPTTVRSGQALELCRRRDRYT